jgi:hypothetical protein
MTFFFIKNKLHWYMYRLLRVRTVYEKLPKISLFAPSIILWLRLLGSPQHPQSGILLTSFSTWGTENSLTEINLDSTEGGGGVLKGYKFLFGSKIGKQLCGLAHYRATRKNLLLPKSSFNVRKTTLWGMVKDYAIILDAIRRSFFD